MESISLRPIVLGPGGTATNPFAAFGAGAGASLKPKAAEAAAARVERKKKPASEILRYTRDQLMSFAQRCKAAPAILAAIPEVAVDPATLDEAGGAVAALAAAVGLAAPGATPDERDWRARTEGGGPGSTAAGSRPDTPAPDGASPSKIVKASDVGRTAWAPAAAEEAGGAAGAGAGGASAAHPESAAAALKAVKGILNKLTPDNFDRLSGQLARLVTSPAILRGTIACLFENAVAQPTFVSLYANLCDHLAAAVPDFPADSDDRGAGGVAGGGAAASSEPGKPIAFRRILLNTCQEEFEGGAAAAAAARAEGAAGAASTAADAGEDAATAAARRTKQRTLGTMRLIAELYVKGVIQERIVHVCLQSLLSTPGGGSGGGAADVPPEDALSAVCEVLTVAGKKLEAGGSGGAKGGAPPALASYFTALERLAKSQALPPRARFMARDVLDLRRSDWVPRRAGLQAKKLEDVRAEARAELGMVAVPDLVLPALAASLPALPSGSLASAGPGGGGGGADGGPGEEEADLFPAFKGGDDGWAAVGSQLATATVKDVPVSSALVGAYTPVPEAAAAAAGGAAGPSKPGAPAPGAGAPAPAPAAPAKAYTPDQRASLAKSVFSDFLASRDAAEAASAAAELLAGAPPAFGADLVRAGVARMFDEPDPASGAAVGALVAALAAGGLPGLPPAAAPLAAAHPASLREGLAKAVGGLEDLALDVPKAPSLLGGLLGAALGAGLGPGGPPTPALSLADLSDLVSPIESAEPRRALVAAALQAAASALGGVDKLAAAAAASGWSAGPALAFDEEFDGEMPSAAEFLEGAGLGAVPV